jgi:uncharacterized membrane protein YkvA (DUF1232 family)
MNLKERAKQLKTDIPAVFLALRHPRTPWTAKALAAVIVAYALSPIDLIPDFIPVLGYLDDALILPLLIALSIKLIPKNIMDECREESKNIWAGGKPKSFKYAIPIIIIWVLILAFVLTKILS